MTIKWNEFNPERDFSNPGLMTSSKYLVFIKGCIREAYFDRDWYWQIYTINGYEYVGCIECQCKCESKVTHWAELPNKPEL